MFLCNAEFSSCWALPEYFRALIHLACLRVFQWRHGLLFNDCIVWDDKSKGIGFKRTHWIHLGSWSIGPPMLQLFQLSQHLHVTNCRLISVTNCRLISSSAFCPWNITLEYKKQLSEGFWDKIPHSKSKTKCFSKEDFFSGGLSLEAIHQSSGSRVRDFFVKTTKDS